MLKYLIKIASALNIDSYLTAAKQLNLKPGQCIVVENAPYGIKASKTAKLWQKFLNLKILNW